jgi:Trk-type K+ transport system membrane component
VLTFVGAFAWLNDRAIARDPEVRGRSFAIGFAMVAAFTTLLMMLQMTVLQQLDGGTPGYGAFIGGWIVYLGLVIWGWRSARPEPQRPSDRLLYGAALFYFVTLTAIMASFDPASHRSAGVHQEAGECYREVADFTGNTRHEFLCARDFDEDYSFECVDALPADGAHWYTVCGRPHQSFGAWMLGVGLLGVIGIGLFTLLLGPARRRLTAQPSGVS